ncbi:MAG: hypothetical protein HY316_02435 [Acidobacteria bacterium]|nr:hypothetical protein [Acidobacteriota bacterium]
MAISKRDRRALQAGGVALVLWLALRFAILPVWDSWRQERTELPLRETALIKFRQALAAAGTDRKTAESLQNRLRETESGLLQSSTPALASAEFQDWVKQTTASHAIELRSSEFLALRPQANGYAQVPLGLQFQCRMDQLAGFLSELRSSSKIVAIPRLQLQSNGGPEKLVLVSLTVAGVMRSQASQTNAAP